MKNFFVFILILSAFFSCLIAAEKESSTTASLGNGIAFTAADSSFSCKLGVILQPRIQAKTSVENSNFVQGEAMIRRMRLRYSGFAFSPKLKFDIQLGFTNQDMESMRNPADDNPGTIFDAYLQWDFAEKASLLFGQLKLPGNLSRLMSFTGLNFLERSQPESIFNLYRDIGIQLHNEFSLGNFAVREKIAFTHGEGRNRATKEGGYCYTGRLELLPFGQFKNKGDLFEPDLEREQKPKLLLGAAACYNDDSWRDRGILGKDLYSPTKITTITGDILFKYAGFSFFGEYYRRDADKTFTYDPKDTTKKTYIYVVTGSGFSASASYVLPCDIGIGLRYSQYEPSSEIEKEKKQYMHTEIGLGLAKYIMKNSLKLQADLSLLKDEQLGTLIAKDLLFRFQLTLGL